MLEDKNEFTKIDYTEGVLHEEPLLGLFSSIGSIESDKGITRYVDLDQYTPVDKSGMSSMSLKVFSKNFSLGSIDIDNKTQNKEIGLNTLKQSIVKKVLQEQFRKGEEQFNKINKEMSINLSLDVTLPEPEPIKFMKNPWKWFLNLFKRKTELVWAPGQKEEMQRRKLVSKIFSMSNLIAMKCRRGAANYIVTNGQIGAILQDIPQFTVKEHNVLNNAGMCYCIGNIGGIKIYVDPYMRWNDTRILIARRNNENIDPGMHLIYNKQSLIDFKNKGNGEFQYGIINTGFDNSVNFITIKLDIPQNLL